jgi:Ca2+-binding EF-hand superfamily protein
MASTQLVAPVGWTSYYFNLCTPQEQQGLRGWFVNVDADRSGFVDATELQNIKFDGKPIGLQVAAKLVSVFDQNRRGCVDFGQYITMHKFIEHMRKAFTTADSDRSGRIESREIQTALQQSSFQFISLGTIEELLKTFDKQRRGLDWPEFLLMTSHIAHCRSVFEWNDKEKQGIVKFSIDEFTQITAYLHGGL